jgi:hypothetical protein
MKRESARSVYWMLIIAVITGGLLLAAGGTCMMSGTRILCIAESPVWIASALACSAFILSCLVAYIKLE